MTRIVCDASPLIFLARLDRLRLVSEVLGGDVFVLKYVVDETSSDKAGPLETARLKAFFDHAQVIDFQASAFPSTTLSRCDQSTLTWAIENRADWLVADERLLRSVAIAQKIPVVGFLGLLVGGARKGFLSPADAKIAIDESISRHGCRISIALYQKLAGELDAM